MGTPPASLPQLRSRILPTHPAGPAPDRPGGHYEPWLPDKLPACAHLRPAIRVPYPYVGATCVDREVEPEVKPSDEAAAAAAKAEEKKAPEVKEEKKDAAAKKAEPAKEAKKEAKKEAAKAPAKEEGKKAESLV